MCAEGKFTKLATRAKSVLQFCQYSSRWEKLQLEGFVNVGATRY